jgi:K+-sensing histidine kinase KdpD
MGYQMRDGFVKNHLLCVVPYDTIPIGHETSYYTEQHHQVEELRRLKTLKEGDVQLNEAGLEAIGELLQGDAVDQIVKYATIIEAGLIVLGHKHHDNWLERWWRSSIPKSFIEHSHCSDWPTNRPSSTRCAHTQGVWREHGSHSMVRYARTCWFKRRSSE